jgi:hypothetical protein
MMSSENKTNLLIAVRGYKTVKKQRNAQCTDVTALDDLNNKVLLRIIEPLGNEFIGIDDIKNVIEFIENESYDSAILISKKFTDGAVNEMVKHKIQLVSDDYMPPFAIEELYLAIMDLVNSQCLKKCGKVSSTKSECVERVLEICKIRTLTGSAKRHFEEGLVGLLKNDLKVALALNR